MADVSVGSDVDAEAVIEVVERIEEDTHPVAPLDNYIDMSLIQTTVPDPLRLRGIGGTTVFGVSSRFDDEYPSQLNGKVAREEFGVTIHRVNSLVQKSVPLAFKCLFVGCLCCCCTAGLSLGPAVILNKRTKYLIEKILEEENRRLYNKLGLNWKLECEKRDSTQLHEYVILIQFLPKLLLYQPD